MNDLHFVDFHTHILPKMDDGSDSLETSLAMLARLEEQGVCDVVLTPHYYSQREPLERFLARREASFRYLQNTYQGPVRLHLAAEVYYSDYIFNQEDLSELCLPGTDILLLELPYNKTIDDRFLDQIFRVSSEFDVTLLLAHVERYPSVIKSRRTLDKLVQIGCLLQINVSSLEVFGRRRLLKMIAAGTIDAIGTDCHNIGSRPPEYTKGLDIMKKKVPGERIQTLMQSMQQMLTPR